jgi:3-oxoacyl-[acyl-carrier protein] reductase
MLLEGKNALVTGGSQGIGAAASLELAREGANICLTYRKHEAEAKKYADEIRQMGRKALALQCDIASFAEAEGVVKAAMEEFGSLEILVNNAGMNWDGVSWKMSEEQWDRVLEVNLKGYFNFTRQAAPIFKDQKYGKIINITSINGLRGKFGQTNYSASKAGIIGYTKALAKELGAFGVNVNAVAPGLIETAMLKGIKSSTWPWGKWPSNGWANPKIWPIWSPFWPRTRPGTLPAKLLKSTVVSIFN